jgi:hypothetical protein
VAFTPDGAGFYISVSDQTYSSVLQFVRHPGAGASPWQAPSTSPYGAWEGGQLLGSREAAAGAAGAQWAHWTGRWSSRAAQEEAAVARPQWRVMLEAQAARHLREMRNAGRWRLRLDE